MEENLQKVVIEVQLVENFKVDEEIIYEILNGLGDHLIPVNNISLNNNILFDNKNGFHRENFKGGNNDEGYERRNSTESK